MQSLTDPDKTIELRGVCVVIPTYNNVLTLSAVLDDVLQYELDVIVVNDGSTDETSITLESYSSKVTLIEFAHNQGKGMALRAGMAEAIKRGYRHAITFDSDGQHLAQDIPKFLTKIEECPDSLIMGARDLEKEGAPTKSSFGNKFSSFWYWAETGIRIPDTQTGFRSYPLLHVREMSFYTRKFEFEIEIIVRLAWRGVQVHSIPIRAVYELENRVSHFRPLIDFLRISVLNTVLFTLSILWFHPVRLIRYVTAKGFWKVVWEDLIDPAEPPLKKSLAVGFGLFMGIIPIWGFQMLVAAALAFVFRLNKLVVLAFSNISVPPMIPLIIYGSYKVGGLFVDNPHRFLDLGNISLDSIWINVTQYIVGATVLALIVGVTGFLITLILLSSARNGREK